MDAHEANGGGACGGDDGGGGDTSCVTVASGVSELSTGTPRAEVRSLLLILAMVSITRSLTDVLDVLIVASTTTLAADTASVMSPTPTPSSCDARLYL